MGRWDEKDTYCLWCGGQPTPEPRGPHDRVVIAGAGGRICSDCIALLGALVADLRAEPGL